MAPGSNKKMKSRRSESFGIRTRKGCSKPVVELRLPDRKEKLWRVMDDLESAKRFVKLVCLYTDGEKAFPPDHPDLPHLEAFRKNEFEVFIWEEFQRHEATELLQDSEDGIDHRNRVGPMMATCAPESNSVHVEVEPNSQNSGLSQEFDLGGGSRAGVICPHHSPWAGDAQLNSSGLHPEENSAMLQHMWREVEREKQLLAYAWCALHQEKREVEREKQLLADAWCALDQKQRGAREGFADIFGNDEPNASLPPNLHEGGPSHAIGFAAMFGNDEPDASLAPNIFEGGPSHATGFAAMFGNDELDASLAPNLYEGGPSHATGSIASLGCDDFFVLPDTPEYVEDISELFP